METPEPPGVVEGMTQAERVDEFIRLLAQGCRVRDAAASVAIHYSTLYRRRDVDPEFAKRWEDATRVKVDHLIKEAERRAMGGSDKLLVFLLQAYQPERFKQRTAIEHEGALSLQVVTGLPDTPVDDLL
jgi:hypothetical protein